jgi:flotillin
MGDLPVDRLTVLGQNGQNGHSNGGSLAGSLVNVTEQIKAATGVDVSRFLRDKVGPESAPKSKSDPNFAVRQPTS